MAWRYFATRPNGDGTETPIAWDLPLDKPELTNALNGHGGLKATITPEVARLIGADGHPLFISWGTMLYAEADGIIRAGAILENDPADGPALTLDAVGHSGYQADQPYTGYTTYTRADPITVSWHMWQHIQAKTGFNIGLTRAGATTSRDVFLGDPDIAPTTTPTSVNPYILGFDQTDDLGKEFEEMANLAPFEWTVKHKWNAGKTQVLHELHYGYPRLGTRRTDLRFVVGENVTEQPTINQAGEDYASHILVRGAGEGQKMIHSDTPARKPTRLGRYKVISDKSLTTPAQVDTRRDAELKAYTGDPDIDTITVTNHHHARIGTYGVGDDILIQTAPGWHTPMQIWARILTITTHPQDNTATLTIRRASKIGAS